MNKIKHKKLLGFVLCFIGLVGMFITSEMQPFRDSFAGSYVLFTSLLVDLVIFFTGVFLLFVDNVTISGGWIELDRQRNRLIETTKKIDEQCSKCWYECKSNCQVLKLKNRIQDDIDYYAKLIVKNGGHIDDDRNA